ncbi:MAG: DNA recombination protein RmuC [Alphaproteobacteria bacterium]
MDEQLLIILGALLLLAATVGLWLWRAEAARRADAARTSELHTLARELAQAQAASAGRLDQMAAASAAELAEVRRAVQERLDVVSKQMGESLTQSSTRTAQSLGEITKHLTVIDQAQQNIKELSGQVVGLQNILDNKQARGAFGELQLNDLVAAILPPHAFEMQAGLGNNRRVDCLIKLANPPGPICIDAKFPLEAYHALRAAETELEAKQAQAGFRQAIQKHVADIAERYILPGETADSALMFLPSEAVYAELHANFPDAVERSYRAKVWIVSPTTLMALLNTVRAVLKDARMREQADLIQHEVQKMLADVQRLEKRVDNLQTHFDQAEKDVKQIGITTDKILKRARQIENVELADEPLDLAPEPVAATPAE